MIGNDFLHAQLAGVVLCVALSAGSQEYFPRGIFYPDNTKLDSSVAKWYSEQLTALQEPSLFEAKQDSKVQSYRFLWLRTFHHPVVVRVVVRPDGSGTVITKMADGAGGYKPGRLIINRTDELTVERVERFLELVHKTGYWSLPERDERRGHDGAEWVIEGANQGKYHIVSRWTPEKGSVRELGLYLLRDVARLDLKGEPIY